jgi:hypothetical protein
MFLYTAERYAGVLFELHMFTLATPALVKYAREVVQRLCAVSSMGVELCLGQIEQEASVFICEIDGSDVAMRRGE